MAMLRSSVRRGLASHSRTSGRHLLATRTFQSSTKLSAEDAAFDPQKTRPESQQNKAGEEAKADTGDATSPVDATANTARDPQEGGGQGSKAEDGQGRSAREGGSGGGSPPKAGGGKSGGGGGT